LGAIRPEPDERWRPARGLADLEQLADELGQAGLSVTVHRTESPDSGRPEDGDALPATVDLTAYRVVQEGLTNVLKHGGDGVRAWVEVDRQPDELTLRIEDDGQGALAADGGGHGLRGMQERVEVFGGRFSAGPRFGGGFRVAVTLPVEAAARVTGDGTHRDVASQAVPSVDDGGRR
jgi:signal transduction histidine kinase